MSFQDDIKGDVAHIFDDLSDTGAVVVVDIKSPTSNDGEVLVEDVSIVRGGQEIILRIREAGQEQSLQGSQGSVGFSVYVPSEGLPPIKDNFTSVVFFKGTDEEVKLIVGSHFLEPFGVLTRLDLMDKFEA